MMTAQENPMKTLDFDDLKALVASRFPLVAEGRGWFGFRWVMNDGKSLRFKIAMTTLSGQPRVLVMSPAAPERDILPRKALEEAAGIGPSVVIEEGLYIVRQWIDLDGLEQAGVDSALALVADGVLRLQAHVQPYHAAARLSAGRPFANFAD
jgi:hypothetical protein